MPFVFIRQNVNIVGVHRRSNRIYDFVSYRVIIKDHEILFVNCNGDFLTSRSSKHVEKTAHFV